MARAAAALGVPMTVSTVSSFTLEQVAEASGEGDALVPAVLAERRGRLREPARAGAGSRLHGPRRHARHLDARLAPARPGPRLPAVPDRGRARQLLRRPGVLRRARKAAARRSARRADALAADVHRHRPQLGRPRLPARALGRADRGQGRAVCRRRETGRRRGHGRCRGVQPRRTPGGRRHRVAARAAGGGRSGRRSARRAVRLGHPHRRGHRQGVGARREGGAGRPAVGLWPRAWAARREFGTCCVACSRTWTWVWRCPGTARPPNSGLRISPRVPAAVPGGG